MNIFMDLSDLIPRVEPVPVPPFWGARVIEPAELSQVRPFLNESSLFHLQWQYRRGAQEPNEHQPRRDEELRPVLDDLLQRCSAEGILQLKAVYGYWPAQAEGDSLIIFDPVTQDRQVARFEFPRMGKPPYWCISDFFRPISDSVPDVVAFMIVIEGALSFLGLGVPSPTPSWGGMIAEGREVLEEAPHVSMIPSFVMFLTVLSFNLIGDSLRGLRDTKEGQL